MVAGGCTVPVRSFRPPAPVAGVVAVSLEKFHELARPGGTIKVLVPGWRAVFVRHNGDGIYEGISAVCTHQGCIVRPTRSGFRCPCHGSSYDADGKNLAGPARRPLAGFSVKRVGEEVLLDLKRRKG